MRYLLALLLLSTAALAQNNNWQKVTLPSGMKQQHASFFAFSTTGTYSGDVVFCINNASGNTVWLFSSSVAESTLDISSNATNITGNLPSKLVAICLVDSAGNLVIALNDNGGTSCASGGTCQVCVYAGSSSWNCSNAATGMHSKTFYNTGGCDGQGYCYLADADTANDSGGIYGINTTGSLTNALYRVVANAITGNGSCDCTSGTYDSSVITCVAGNPGASGLPILYTILVDPVHNVAYFGGETGGMKATLPNTGLTSANYCSNFSLDRNVTDSTYGTLKHDVEGYAVNGSTSIVYGLSDAANAIYWLSLNTGGGYAMDTNLVPNNGVGGGPNNIGQGSGTCNSYNVTTPGNNIVAETTAGAFIGFFYNSGNNTNCPGYIWRTTNSGTSFSVYGNGLPNFGNTGFKPWLGVNPTTGSRWLEVQSNSDNNEIWIDLTPPQGGSSNYANGAKFSNGAVIH